MKHFVTNISKIQKKHERYIRFISLKLNNFILVIFVIVKHQYSFSCQNKGPLGCSVDDSQFYSPRMHQVNLMISIKISGNYIEALI